MVHLSMCEVFEMIVGVGIFTRNELFVIVIYSQTPVIVRRNKLDVQTSVSIIVKYRNSVFCLQIIYFHGEFDKDFDLFQNIKILKAFGLIKIY